MKSFYKIRNAIIGWKYRNIVKRIAFNFNPEFVHNHFVRVGKFLGYFGLTKRLTSFFFNFEDKILEQNVLGISFKNPVGLSAGFDKEAELTDIIPSIGFGFEEVGSITAFPCKGNKGKRLWRVPKLQSILVYYGLKNGGSEVIFNRLSHKTFRIPVGTNIAMTNCKENEDIDSAILDYAKSFEKFSTLGHYTTINISCPNTSGGQPFMEPHNLERLLVRLDTIPTTKPVLVKISPDISMGELDQIIDCLKKHRVAGIICSNLTKNSQLKKENNLPMYGGLSGKPTEEYSLRQISHIYKREGNRFVIIGVGGVFGAEDAYKKIKAGASLVEFITGMIYKGPSVVSDINMGLVELLKRDGFKNISDAIGKDSV